MFLSAKSFADLEGKALLCKWEGDIDGYSFERRYKYREYFVDQINDTFRVRTGPLHDYKMNPEVITLFLDWKINRKTLRIFNTVGDYRGQCELTDYETILDRMKEHKNELQKIYNKKLEGNKI